MSDIDKIIRELERNKEAINSAIAALRGSQSAAIALQKRGLGRSPVKQKQHHMSEEGRKRIAEAQRQRWAAKKASLAVKKAAGKKSGATKKAAAKKRTPRKSAAER